MGHRGRGPLQHLIGACVHQIGAGQFSAGSDGLRQRGDGLWQVSKVRANAESMGYALARGLHTVWVRATCAPPPNKESAMDNKPEQTVAQACAPAWERANTHHVSAQALAADVASAVRHRYAPHCPRGMIAARVAPAPLLRWNSGRPAGEENDCSVRALSNVSALSYEEAHALIGERCGRKRGKGPEAYAYRDLLDSMATRLPYDSLVRTLAAFIKAHPRGVFLVWIRGHALALIDGAIVDTGYCGRRNRLEYAWKFAD